jgi:electron transport complex protein RnfE
MRQFKTGILEQNPVLVLLLGLCPALATTVSLFGAVGMGLAVTAVLVFSGFTVSLLRNVISEKIRFAAFIVIIATYVTVADHLLQAFFPELSERLGIFVPLITANCIIFARVETFAYRNGIARSALDGLAAGMGFLLVLIAIGAVRELLSAGTLFDFRILPDTFPYFAVMAKPAGGFFALAVVAAVAQAARNKRRSVL